MWRIYALFSPTISAKTQPTLTLRVQQHTLLDEQHADDLLHLLRALCRGLRARTGVIDLRDDRGWNIDFFVDRHATVPRLADLLEQGVVELGLDRQHEHVLDRRHGLADYLFLEVERSPDDGDGVGLEVTAVRRLAGVHGD